MKQWLSAHILSPENFNPEDIFPISSKEFYISIGMLTIALALYGAALHLL